MPSDLHPRSLAQFVRFAIGGVAITFASLGVYSLVVLIFHLHPQIGNLAAYLVGLASGYVIHSQWSFRDHGADRTHATRFRFIAASIATYALNIFWVWLLYSRMNLGRTAPMLPMTLITPTITFVLNRRWVFR